MVMRPNVQTPWQVIRLRKNTSLLILEYIKGVRFAHEFEIHLYVHVIYILHIIRLCGTLFLATVLQ